MIELFESVILSKSYWLDISDDNQTDKYTLPKLKKESNDRHQIEKKQ